MTLVLNLFAGPGAGKSTTAAAVFAELKRLGVNAELASEYAKDKFYEGTLKSISDYPIYFFAKQHHRVARAAEHVDVVVTDSPFIMGLLYQGGGPELKALAMAEQNRWETLNIFLHRPQSYAKQGRSQTREESERLDELILQMLRDNGVKFCRVDVDENTSNFVAQWVLQVLENSDN